MLLASLHLFGCQGSEQDHAQVAIETKEGLAPESKKLMNQKELTSPLGNWTHQIAPDYWLSVKSTASGIFVNWEPTLDSDILIEGELTAKGANVFHGDVRFISGDEEKKSALTLRFDGHRRTLSMEFPTFFEETMVFKPASNRVLCAEKAMELVTNLKEFQSLSAGDDAVALLDESEDDVRLVFDYRAHSMGKDGDMQTVGRFKVDLEEGKAYMLDLSSGNYLELKTAEKAVAALDCQ